jgi:hypothetical protein
MDSTANPGGAETERYEQIAVVLENLAARLDDAAHARRPDVLAWLRQREILAAMEIDTLADDVRQDLDLAISDAHEVFRQLAAARGHPNDALLVVAAKAKQAVEACSSDFRRLGAQRAALLAGREPLIGMVVHTPRHVRSAGFRAAATAAASTATPTPADIDRVVDDARRVRYPSDNSPGRMSPGSI